MMKDVIECIKPVNIEDIKERMRTIEREKEDILRRAGYSRGIQFAVDYFKDKVSDIELLAFMQSAIKNEIKESN